MRVTTSKSKNSESFYITKAFIDKNKKSTSKIHRKLGTLAELCKTLDTDRDGVMKWAKEEAERETQKYNKECEDVKIPFSTTKIINKNETRSFNCGYLFLQSLLYKLRIDNTFRNIKNRHDYKFDLSNIFSDLIYSRILHPSSKRETFKYSNTLLEQPLYDEHQVYRALSILSKESDYIQSELYKNSHFIHNRNTKILYYDCTNYYFEIEQADSLRKYGKSKENRPNPIVQMGLFMDADGIPLAFDIFPGNQNEQKSLKPIEEKILRDFDCSEFIYCSDAGLGSKNNKMLNHLGGRSFLITQSLKKLKKEDLSIALSPKQYKRVGSDSFIDLNDLDENDETTFNSIYYKKIPAESSIENETIVVTYSPKYKAYQEKIRDTQIKRAENMISNGNKISKTHKNPNDPARFINKTSITENGEVADKEIYKIDTDAINKEKKFDGFYAVTTDLDVDIAELVKINKRRWEIEECFRIMKTEFKARPVYLQREDRIKAHFLTCFVSLLLYRLLENKLNNKYTTTEIVNNLRNMNVGLIDGYGYIPTYTRTEFTDDLHEIFGFRTDTEIIKKAKMRNIISYTKTT